MGLYLEEERAADIEAVRGSSVIPSSIFFSRIVSAFRRSVYSSYSGFAWGPSRLFWMNQGSQIVWNRLESCCNACIVTDIAGRQLPCSSSRWCLPMVLPPPPGRARGRDTTPKNVVLHANVAFVLVPHLAPYPTLCDPSSSHTRHKFLQSYPDPALVRRVCLSSPFVAQGLPALR